MVAKADNHPDTEDDQRRDALLLQVLKTPPQPRPKRERGHGQAAKFPSSASAGKLAPPA